MPLTIDLKNAAETKAFGKWLAGKLKAGQIISLEGPLGAGKTTLIQGLVKELGVPQEITSPTFILFRVHPVEKTKTIIKQGIKWLVHADAYRVKDSEEMLAAGIEDYLNDPETVTIIEWGDRLKKILPRRTKRIFIRIPKTGRRVTFPKDFGKPPAKLP